MSVSASEMEFIIYFFSFSQNSFPFNFPPHLKKKIMIKIHKDFHRVLKRNTKSFYTVHTFPGLPYWIRNISLLDIFSEVVSCQSGGKRENFDIFKSSECYKSWFLNKKIKGGKKWSFGTVAYVCKMYS